MFAGQVDRTRLKMIVRITRPNECPPSHVLASTIITSCCTVVVSKYVSTAHYRRVTRTITGLVYRSYNNIVSSKIV